METENCPENSVLAKGKEIFEFAGNESAQIFNRNWWYGKMMDWCIKNEKFKVQMFRFIDVLPYLNDSDELSRHIREYFLDSGIELPQFLQWGIDAGTSFSLFSKITSLAVKKNVLQFSQVFIAGANPSEALKIIKKQREKNFSFTADLLGEAVLSEYEADEYQRRYLELIEVLKEEAGKWKRNPIIDTCSDGDLPNINISIKVSAMFSQIDPANHSGSVKKIIERLRPIFKRAKENQIFLNLDLEQYAFKNIILDVFKKLLDEEEFKSYNHIGIVIQAYLKDSENDLRGLIEWCKQKNRKITIRLVKGAYWDYEVIQARQKNWEVPVFTNKSSTDNNFENLSSILLENNKYVRTAIASHNVRSIAHALVYAEKLGLPKNAVELQMLYGMAEPIKQSLGKMGYHIREYITIGELIPGMAYLVRRLLENTSNQSFLMQKYAENVDLDKLLQKPLMLAEDKKAIGPLSFQSISSLEKFRNEPLFNFAFEENRTNYETSISKVRKSLGGRIPLIIGGKEETSDKEIKRENPAKPDELIAICAAASKQQVEHAINLAEKSLKEWESVDPEKRSEILIKTAENMRKKRRELAALMIFEAGKTWKEADGDVTEAIDFLEYYAREALRLCKYHKTSDIPGDASVYFYQPKGIGFIVSPWNFPLAILTGMTAAALVTGNTVLIKPSSFTPAIAYEMVKSFLQAGIPDNVINFIPSYSSETGDYIVSHPKINFIAFTGSKEVGTHIIELSAKFVKGQKYVKKVIAEMGGKNAIIVDSDADLDEAVSGIIYSAFGYAGQKCSACSRVIVLKEIYEKFISRIEKAASSIVAGLPENPESYLGPVISESAKKSISAYIEYGMKNSTLLFQGNIPQNGYFVPPTIFIDVKPDSRIAQEEIFGPVLSVIKVNDFEEAIKVANDVEFALTGGIFSRSPKRIEIVKKKFKVGNLYINRGITGALVERHPFGGFNLSGTGTKAGGFDYLLHFMDPRCITENTMRRGFAPEF